MAKTGTNIKNYDNSPDMGNVDYVVEWQKPTERNGYTWYRLYASGWIIQGQRIKGISTREYTGLITLPKQMSDTNYNVFVIASSNRGTNTDWNFTGGCTPKSTSQFSFSLYGLGTSDIVTNMSWIAIGYAMYGLYREDIHIQGVV